MRSMERFNTAVLLAGLLCALCTLGVGQTGADVGQMCHSFEFRCSNGVCVHKQWRCDHSADCIDGSDEENCEQDECEVNNGGCSHYCVDLPHGFMCECPPDMRLVHDTHCEELDPCLDADVCDQLCVHSNGSFTCECRHGYVKSSENGRCFAADDAAAVIFSSSEGIMWMKPDGSGLRNIINTTGTSGALTSLSDDNTLYWTQHTHIYKLVLDAGPLDPTVMFSGVSGIVSLSVDWINRVLYWTSTSTRAVHAAALNGTEHVVLISGLQSPGAVAVQSLAGFLFWTDTGDSPRIERSDLNGQNRRTLVSSAIHNPVSITLDEPRGLLYWADSSLRTVSRVTYDGLHRKTVLESNSHLDQPFGLAVFEDAVYWSDRATGVICSADKHNGKLLKVTHLSEASSPAGLVLYHPLLQPTDMTTPQTKPSPMDPDSAFSFSRVLSLIGQCLSYVCLCLVTNVSTVGVYSNSLISVSDSSSFICLVYESQFAIHLTVQLKK
ncbi:low-density lipoprotein receptor-related protein 8-like [Clarias gariepinus]